eukprot:366476-Chlamydomonas_euryale.AAC.18
MSIPEPAERARAREAARGAHRWAVPPMAQTRAETSAGACRVSRRLQGAVQQDLRQASSTGERASDRRTRQRASTLAIELASGHVCERAGGRASKPAPSCFRRARATATPRSSPAPCVSIVSLRPAWPALAARPPRPEGLRRPHRPDERRTGSRRPRSSRRSHVQAL